MKPHEIKTGATYTGGPTGTEARIVALITDERHPRTGARERWVKWATPLRPTFRWMKLVSFAAWALQASA